MSQEYNEDGTPVTSAKLRLTAAIKAATRPAKPNTPPPAAGSTDSKTEAKEDGEFDEQVRPATLPSLSSHNLLHVPSFQPFKGDIPTTGKSKMANAAIPPHDVYLIPRPPPPPLSLPILPTHNVIFGQMISLPEQHNSGSFSHKVYNGNKGLREAHLALHPNPSPDLMFPRGRLPFWALLTPHPWACVG